MNETMKNRLIVVLSAVSVLLLIVASFLLLTRSQFARIVGLTAAAIMALSAMTWMPYYPIWALTYVFLAMLAIYGLATYGGRLSSQS